MSLPVEPFRVAFLITDLDPGGAERALVQLVTRLDRSRWEPYVFCLSRPGRLVDDLEGADIPVVCLGATNSWNVLVPMRLYAHLRRLKPALLQTFLFHANIVGRIAGRLAGVRTIVSGIRVAEKRSRWRLNVDRWTDALVSRHVCVSRAVAEFSSKQGGLAEEKLVVIANGVDAAKFANAQPADLTTIGIPSGSLTVISVARLDPQKDPFVLLEAAERVMQSRPELHLLFVGEGVLRNDIEAWARARGLNKHVHLTGWRSDVAELLRAADCFVLTSRWEGMANAVLEAMAAGLPVIATAAEGTSEIIEHGRTGILIPPQSSEVLAEQLQSLVASETERNALSSAAQHHVTERFTVGACVSAYEAMYGKLLDC